MYFQKQIIFWWWCLLEYEYELSSYNAKLCSDLNCVLKERHLKLYNFSVRQLWGLCMYLPNNLKAQVEVYTYMYINI